MAKWVLVSLQVTRYNFLACNNFPHEFHYKTIVRQRGAHEGKGQIYIQILLDNGAKFLCLFLLLKK